MTDRLDITFEGPRVDEAGVSLDDFRKTLDRVQRTLRLMVGHLAGLDTSRGRPPGLVREQSALRLLGTLPGSLVAELELAPPKGTQLRQDSHGAVALGAILAATGVDDPALPEPVRECLATIGTDLSSEVVAVSLGDAGGSRRVRIVRRPGEGRRRAAEREPALVYGLLLEVNWENGTAQLHEPYGDADRYVRLRFDSALNDNLLRLAMQYVEVRGHGRFNDDGDWIEVRVEEIAATRSMWEPFDMDAFLNDPNPKIFDPEEVIRASEPFDADEFLRAIREGRNV